MKLFLSIALLAAATLASAADKPKGYRNLTGFGYLFDRVEYRTYEELVFPLKQKLEKGKMEEMDFKVEEKIIPKGGVLAVEAKTKNGDPVVKVQVKAGEATVASCDESTSKPGITYKFDSFTHKYTGQEDEDDPIMTFECPLRIALPDSFAVDLVTVGGKTASTYRFGKAK